VVDAQRRLGSSSSLAGVHLISPFPFPLSRCTSGLRASSRCGDSLRLSSTIFGILAWDRPRCCGSLAPFGQHSLIAPAPVSSNWDNLTSILICWWDVGDPVVETGLRSREAIGGGKPILALAESLGPPCNTEIWAAITFVAESESREPGPDSFMIAVVQAWEAGAATMVHNLRYAGTIDCQSIQERVHAQRPPIVTASAVGFLPSKCWVPLVSTW
jgi:hypothetical protein